MREIDWTECPTCSRTVPVVGGVLGVHMTPRELRKWPKMVSECPRSGTALSATATRTPLLGEI